MRGQFTKIELIRESETYAEVPLFLGYENSLIRCSKSQNSTINVISSENKIS
jgi:hypothetical protein